MSYDKEADFLNVVREEAKEEENCPACIAIREGRDENLPRTPCDEHIKLRHLILNIFKMGEK